MIASAHQRRGSGVDEAMAGVLSEVIERSPGDFPRRWRVQRLSRLGCPAELGMGDSLVERSRGANRRDPHTSPTRRSTHEMRGYDVPTMGAREGTDDFRR